MDSGASFHRRTRRTKSQTAGNGRAGGVRHPSQRPFPGGAEQGIGRAGDPRRAADQPHGNGDRRPGHAAAGAQPAGGPRSALSDLGAEDQHRSGAHRRPGAAHRRAFAVADAPSAGEADDRHPQDGVAGAVDAAALSGCVRQFGHRDGAQRPAGRRRSGQAARRGVLASCWPPCSATPAWCRRPWT